MLIPSIAKSKHRQVLRGADQGAWEDHVGWDPVHELGLVSALDVILSIRSDRSAESPRTRSIANARRFLRVFNSAGRADPCAEGHTWLSLSEAAACGGG